MRKLNREEVVEKLQNKTLIVRSITALDGYKGVLEVGYEDKGLANGFKFLNSPQVELFDPEISYNYFIAITGNETIIVFQCLD